MDIGRTAPGPSRGFYSLLSPGPLSRRPRQRHPAQPGPDNPPHSGATIPDNTTRPDNPPHSGATIPDNTEAQPKFDGWA
ncbi:hypothetical protein [Actinoplanes regularis]|uniref:hypothetical protein n=1 Tax=Actinoplanes regularis TaxID=52697 RepID=UPI0024A4892E|nr:hypothetical protein [Actinoplanes regularis]GLW31109.1 hypothetical protein Areg01_40490 [Actinoplanes regularis]